VGSGAVLAGVVVGGAGDRLERSVELDVVEDHDRGLAAELEVHALERPGRVLGDPLAGFHRAGERDHVDVVVLDERWAGVVVPQPFSKAPRAAFTARSTSSRVELGAWAISSPVAGL
jgi:hypothetical protein